MNNFKVGDKVYRLEDRKEVNKLWEVSSVQVMKKGDKEYYNYVLKSKGVDSKFLGSNNNNIGRVALLNFEEDIEPYFTPHERLLKLGWEMRDTDGTYKTYDKFDDKYSRRTMSIKINKDQDGWYFTASNATYIDKELTTILLEYLEELEKHNEQ